MGTTNTLDLNNRVTNLEKAVNGLTASDIMLSDGVTSVEDALDEVAERIIQRTYYTTSTSTATYDVYDWHANIKVEGYIPIMYCFQHGSSGSTMIGCEAFSNIEIFGYCSRPNLQITLRILYMKA